MQRFQVTIVMSEALWRTMRAQAAREDRSLSAVARRALGAHYGVEARPAEEIPLHPDASANTPAESRVEYDRAPEVDLGDGPPDEPGTGRVGNLPLERVHVDPARLARARAVLGRADRGGLNVSVDLAPKPARQAISQPESRVEYDHEALRASKRSGNDSGRGL